MPNSDQEYQEARRRRMMEIITYPQSNPGLVHLAGGWYAQDPNNLLEAAAGAG